MSSQDLLKYAKIFRFALIQVPIRDMKNFCMSFPPKLKSKIENIQNSLQIPSVSEETLDDYFRQIFRSIRLWDLENWQNHYFKDLNEQLNRLVEIGNTLLTTKHYVLDYFEFFTDCLKRIKEKIENLLHIVERDLQEESDHKERYSYYLEYPEENIANGKLYFSILELPQKLQEILREINYYLPALEEKKRVFISNYYGKQDEAPSSESTEILYHTTINADKILTNGFAHGEAKMEGLGGSQETHSGKKSISFTYDLHVAKEIARCLKEAIMIANSEISWNDIVEWSANPEKILNSYREIYSSTNTNEPKNTFNLYRIYLSYANRYDPLFFGSAQEFLQIFQGRNPKDVGIIKAKVDMTNEDITYLQGMLEYRVPPKAVISIEGVIR